jgi:hypothetical protein
MLKYHVRLFSHYHPNFALAWKASGFPRTPF